MEHAAVTMGEAIIGLAAGVLLGFVMEAGEETTSESSAIIAEGAH
jgi:hypothetical protein